MKKDSVLWICRICYSLLCVFPILYIVVLIVLDKMGYSLRILPKQCMYISYILLIMVSIVVRLAKPKRILSITFMILYLFGIGFMMPKEKETLVLYNETVCISQVRDIWLETYPWVYYHPVENWFLMSDQVVYSYRLNQ